MQKRSAILLSACLALVLLVPAAPLVQAGAYKVYSTYLWHLQQPNYWPEKVSGQNRYMFAHEHLSGSPTWPGHPENNISDIFGKDDRVAIYQYRSRDSVSSIGQPDGGAQLSYSGCLIENIWSLGDNYELGYGPTWYSGIREAMGWTTTRGKRKLEPVGFTYHHALAPLIDKDALEKEIEINKHMWWKAWNGNPDLSDHPKGFRCAEETFSIRIIGELVEAGYEWVIVPNHHLSRTHPNYQQLHGKGLYDWPNKADQINPPNNGGWYSGEIDGRGSTESIPFSFQAHRAKYIDPETGTEYKIIVVPMTDLGSYRDGYSEQGIGILDSLNAYASYDQPCIALFSHDGDNAWGGGYSYYQQAVPNFSGSAAAAGYRPTTIQTFLDENPPPENDVVHVEDGSWFNAADDWGHPQYWNWLWPPQRDRSSPAYDYNDPSTWADIEGGWAEDFRNWAVIVAGQNFVSTAEQVHEDNGGAVEAWRIQEPVTRSGTDNGANDAELAWHFFLPALTSGYMYYGSSIDMEVKQSLACNQAITYAENVITNLAQENTPPTVFIPQRYPYNPGTTNYGSAYGYQAWVAPSDFYIWTFAFDVSGVTNVVLNVRTDKDGYNPLSDNDNEVYATNSGVNGWTSYTMVKRAGSSFAGNIFNSGEIDFFIMPDEIADQYYYHITDDYSGKLLDYYVEAWDANGNVKRTDIQHVFVGSEGGGPVVSFSPSAPRDCDDLAVTYRAEGRPLEGAGSVTMAYTYDNWSTSNDVAMAALGGNTWKTTNSIQTGTTNVIVQFHNAGTGDDDGGAGWAVAVSDCTGPQPSDLVFDPVNPTNCDPVKVIYHENDGPLSGASAVYLHIGRNGWDDVIDPEPLMTGPSASNTWEYTYAPDAGTLEINCAVNNGDSLWDNNGGEDWSVTVTGCDNPVTVTPAAPEDCDDLVITFNAADGDLSAADPVTLAITFDNWTVSNDYTMSGTAGGNWSYTNDIPDGSTNALFFFHDGAGTAVGDSAPWEVAISGCSTDNIPSGAYFSPAAPSGCDDVTVIYHAGNGVLKDANPVYIHIGHDTWQDVITPDPAMTPVGTNWQYTYSLEPGTEEINVAFNDGGSTWDNNSGNDWAVSVSNCSVVFTQTLYLVEGSPSVSSDPGDQNNIGDNLDLTRSGGAAITTDQGGFGTFGQIYFNYDATNLYIGAAGANVAGSNNAMVLFVELNTLNYNSNNLWGMSGTPQGLDSLHNLWLNPGMDIAILLGDEWGDGTYANFNLGDGYDFGQGVFYLSPAAFSNVPNAVLSQFDGSSTNATTTTDDDGNRLTDRWETCLPWNSLNATSVEDITSCYIAGLIVNSSTGGVGGVDRYISGNYLGLTATNDAARDEFNNYAFTFVTLDGLEVGFESSDTDGDGIPNTWETRYFGGPTNATASVDSDGDLFSNWEEYLLGTHPMSYSSTFVFTNLTATSSFPRVTWTSVGGKTYAIDYADDLSLLDPFQTATQRTETDVDNGVGSVEVFEDDYSLTGGAPTNGFRCYRIRLIP